MEHLINLNFAPGGLPATVHVSQYDDTIRQLRFQLWFGRSKVEVPSGASVRVDIKKPDGHIVLVNGTVNSSDRSIVTVPTTKQMTAVPGGSRGTLVVSSTGDKRISSAIFILQVHRDPVEDGDASDSDLSMLQDAIDQTAANATAAQAAATAAQQAAESFTVDSTLDSTSTNAIQNKAVAAGFAAINESLEEIIPVNLAKDVTYTESRALYYNNGDTFVSSDFSTSEYIDISACSTIIYMRYCSTGTASKIGIAFYDANKSYLSGVRCVLSASTAGFVLSEEDVPEDAKYIRIPCYKVDAPTILYDKSDYDAKTLSRLEVAEADIETLEKAQAETAEKIGNVLNNGYFKLPVDKWERGGWLGYSSKDSRSYRVRYTETLVFDRDVYILADAGYNINGYKSDGNALGTGTMMKIPANTSFKLYVRRLVEDATETVDVATFAGKVKISTAFAPIEMYSPTFTDVSMFERMGISGDSYSSGGGIISGVTPLTWGKNLERQAGITVDIYAKSGDTIVTWNTNTTKGLPALLAGAECGLYWFQHGINGTGSAEAIGTPEDMEAEQKPDTFYGQYAYAIEAVKNAFPNAKIVIATITGSSWGLSQSTYAAANTAIKNIAEYEEIPCIDIAEDDFFRSGFYSANIRSQHPTAMLAAGMAMAYRRLISKCIQDNPDYFINYGA